MGSTRVVVLISYVVVLFFFFFFLVRGTESAKPSHYSVPFNRTLFPPSFIFGAGSAAYQSEGAANIDGRGPSIWDTFTKQHPEKILDHSNGAVADDFYHRYKRGIYGKKVKVEVEVPSTILYAWYHRSHFLMEGDIKLMKKIGLDSFRFSISWSRIFPKGKGTVNHLGVRFYNNLINELLSNGLTPFVTLFHLDLPQALEDEYGGFLSPKIVKDFGEYADFCFKTFGDRVKRWVTLNEPYGYSNNGYNTGSFPPGRCSNYVGNCTSGNSATEPYLVTHNLILAHTAAARLYKAKYQKYQKGEIGITLVTHWMEPKSNTPANRLAATRALDFWFGWFADPITYGDYPQSMRSVVGDRLPKFTKAESEMVKGSCDFIGVNYYTTNYAENSPLTSNVNRSYSSDMQATLSAVRNGVPVGTPTALSWLYIYPKGLHQLLLYVKHKYNDPLIYVNENGVAQANNASIPVKEAIKDGVRIRYYDGHLRYLLQSIKDGVKVKGYYAWSFFDDFEWDAGYTVRFGITYVDFKNNLKRYLKYSGYWLKMFLLR